MNFQELMTKLSKIEGPVVEAEQSVEECGMPGMSDMPSGMMGMRNDPPKQADNVNMNVSINASGSGGIKDLMNILRSIEDGESDDITIDKMPLAIGTMGKALDDDFANEPDEMYMQHDFNAGADLNRPKAAYPAAQRGDNPMAVESLKSKLGAMYESIKNR